MISIWTNYIKTVSYSSTHLWQNVAKQAPLSSSNRPWQLSAMCSVGVCYFMWQHQYCVKHGCVCGYQSSTPVPLRWSSKARRLSPGTWNNLSGNPTMAFCVISNCTVWFWLSFGANPIFGFRAPMSVPTGGSSTYGSTEALLRATLSIHCFVVVALSVFLRCPCSGVHSLGAVSEPAELELHNSLHC